jgi:hypothetical protein
MGKTIQGIPVASINDNRSVITGTTSAALPNTGVSVIPYSTNGNKFTLAAPAQGTQATLILSGTVAPDATAKWVYVYSGSTGVTMIDDSTAYNPKLFIGFQPPNSSVSLVGLSASQWNVINKSGTVRFSTSASFSS